jgi:SOS response regulatory protein OraA/RecX
MFDQIFYSLDLDLESSCYSFLEKYSNKDRDKLIRKAVNRGFSYEQVKNNLKKLDNSINDML